MATKYKLGNSDAGATITDELRQVIDLMLDHAGDGIGRVMLNHVDRIVADAEPLVPVKSGKLKESLASYVKSTSEEIRVGASMGGNTPGKDAYAYAVMFAAERAAVQGPLKKNVKRKNYTKTIPVGEKGKNVFATLVGRPVRAAIKDITIDAAKALDAIASGKGRVS